MYLDTTKIDLDVTGVTTTVTPDIWHQTVMSFISRRDANYSNIRIFYDRVLIISHGHTFKTVDLTKVSVASDHTPANFFLGTIYYNKLFN